MPKYKVKSLIQRGALDKDGKNNITDYPAGSEIELTEAEAYEARHALHDGPRVPQREVDVLGGAARRGAREDGDDLGDLDEEEQAAYESILNRPDNPDSGVQLHWKTDPIARAHVAAGTQPGVSRTRAVGSGYERAHAGLAPDDSGLSGTMTRPEANKTVMEREDEPKIAEHQKQLEEKARQKIDTSPKVVGVTPVAGQAPAPAQGNVEPAKK